MRAMWLLLLLAGGSVGLPAAFALLRCGRCGPAAQGWIACIHFLLLSL